MSVCIINLYSKCHYHLSFVAYHIFYWPFKKSQKQSHTDPLFWTLTDLWKTRIWHVSIIFQLKSDLIWKAFISNRERELLHWLQHDAPPINKQLQSKTATVHVIIPALQSSHVVSASERAFLWVITDQIRFFSLGHPAVFSSVIIFLSDKNRFNDGMCLSTFNYSSITSICRYLYFILVSLL